MGNKEKEGNSKGLKFISANMRNTTEEDIKIKSNVKEDIPKIKDIPKAESQKAYYNYSNISETKEKGSNKKIIMCCVAIAIVILSITTAGSKKTRLAEEEAKKQSEIVKKEEKQKEEKNEGSVKDNKELIATVTHKVVSGKRVPYDDKDKKMELNVEYIIRDKNGEYSLIVEGIRLAEDKKRDFQEEHIKQIIFLDYKYKNINSKDLIEICQGELKLIDEDGKEVESYTISEEKDKYATFISKGKERNVSIMYGMTEKYKSLKLVFSDGDPMRVLGEFIISTGL